MTFKWINNAIFHCFSSHHQCSSSNCTNLPLIWCPLTTTVWSTLSKSIIDWCPPPSTSFTSGAMSSLLKINQKFLSKSSWSIRGNGSNNNNSNNSGNSNSNSRGGNQRSSVPYSVNKFALSPLNQTGNHTIAPSGKVGHTFDSKRRPNVSNNGSQRGVEARLSSAYDKRQTLQYDAQSTPTRASNNSRISRANQSPHQLVINQHHFNNHSSSLKRSKGMSHSITDLRELKEKPKKHFSTNDESDEFQLEIKERRIDMYIAEIEMEPLFQLGSTIRWAFWIFICKQLTRSKPFCLYALCRSRLLWVCFNGSNSLSVITLIHLLTSYIILSSFPIYFTMSRSIFSNNSNTDSKYDHLLVELETSDTSTVALVLRLTLHFLLLFLKLNQFTNCSFFTFKGNLRWRWTWSIYGKAWPANKESRQRHWADVQLPLSGFCWLHSRVA